jgi:hypothetical protein
MSEFAYLGDDLWVNLDKVVGINDFNVVLDLPGVVISINKSQRDNLIQAIDQRYGLTGIPQSGQGDL